MNASLISIVLPIHNQADHLNSVVESYIEALRKISNPCEIILVTNGCRDNSLTVCQALAGQYTAVRVKNSEMAGWGLAVRLGLAEARGDILCYTNLARTSADDLTLMLLYSVAHSDVVIKTNRKIRESWQRRLGSLLYNLECRALFDLPYWDINGTPKVFPRRFDKLLALKRDDDLIDAEFNIICRREGYRVIEIPTFSPKRHGGRSTTNYRSAIRMYWGAYKMWRALEKRKAEGMKRVARKKPDQSRMDKLWARHDTLWRDPAEVISQWQGANEIDPRLLRYSVRGDWWKILAACGVTLLVTREYEHLVIAMRADEDRPHVSYLPLPHPSGLAVDRKRNRVYVASTRNPNQILDLMPVTALLDRQDVKIEPLSDRPLVPVRSRYLPGSLYLHDLAMIGDRLHASAVGENAIVRLFDDGRYERVWWPRSIETDSGPIFSQNHLQLNSIAAGANLTTSYFSASTEKPSLLRPGHRNFPVDKRGVIFSGATRESIVRGLTRPHSARLYQQQLWVNNSGYGELCVVRDGGFENVARLPGWTRGLCFHDDIAFVGTSRVIPRFRQYAPGLDVDKSRCGVYAVDTRTGKVLGSLTWPQGNQIFAVEWVQSSFASGFPFTPGAGKRRLARTQQLFYSFQTQS